MFIKHLHGNIFDVFFGTQWDEWVRVRKGRSFVSAVGGMRVPHATLKSIETTLNNTYIHPHGTLVN